MTCQADQATADLVLHRHLAHERSQARGGVAQNVNVFVVAGVRLKVGVGVSTNNNNKKNKKNNKKDRVSLSDPTHKTCVWFLGESWSLPIHHVFLGFVLLFLFFPGVLSKSKKMGFQRDLTDTHFCLKQKRTDSLTSKHEQSIVEPTQAFHYVEFQTSSTWDNNQQKHVIIFVGPRVFFDFSSPQSDGHRFLNGPYTVTIGNRDELKGNQETGSGIVLFEQSTALGFLLVERLESWSIIWIY